MIKGVVYNEMKGAMSQPDRQIIETLNREVFTPNTTYHFNSGGDPEIIPTLTYEKLKQFHATCYHPSNAKFFSYGLTPTYSFHSFHFSLLIYLFKIWNNQEIFR